MARIGSGRMGSAIAALAACALAAPALAAIPKVPPRPVAPDDGATLAAAARFAQASDCAGVLRTLDPLVARVAAGPVRARAQLLRLTCFVALGRPAEAAPLIAELRAAGSTDPVVLAMEVLAEGVLGRYALAADRLAALADTGSPGLAMIPGVYWRAVARELAGDPARLDRATVALARARWNPSDEPDLAETIAADAVGVLAADKQRDEARQMLARVRTPGRLWGMAIRRRYAALWPDIETRIGPAMAASADAYARTALDAFADHPDDDRSRRDAMLAFAALGRPDDMVSTAASVAIAPGMSELRVETVLTGADAAAAVSGDAAAVARLRPFATIDTTASAAAAGVILLAEALHNAGGYAEELSVARAALARPGGFSPFGVAWLRRNEVCALAGQGKADDARRAAAAVAAHASDNVAAAVEAQLCAGQDDVATAIAIPALATRDGADRLAAQFQPTGAMQLHPASRFRPLWARLLARPAVRAAFDRAARILPERLWPATTPRAVPQLRGAGATTT